MCEEVDAHKSSESEYTTDDEWEEEQKKTRANWEKERVTTMLFISLFKKNIK
jgi:hypothetical protein